MANIRMLAKNGFHEGLILDLSPTNSSANSLSSALNATLVTYNGNELSLQNDMGNTRVETAFLPEGYIPVGTCEFGDIIYVVSYNPIINKSLIGCFPSPERNISTEEIGATIQTLSWEDFQKVDEEGNLTGELKATSVKKILYGNRYMHSGDKYIIYSDNIGNDSNLLSDYGNTSYTHGTFPKFVKIHVVSIEDSGKIVYLDSSTKWYDNNYYIKKENVNLKESNTQLVDGYRDLVSSAYSVFNSKVSGKLALLIELEKINGFSCAWKARVDQDGNTNKYKIDFHFNWTTDDNNVNISSVKLTKNEWAFEKWYPWVSDGNGGLVRGRGKGEVESKDIALPNRDYFDITRHYAPETFDTIDYERYLSDYEYSVYETKMFGDIKEYENIDGDIISVKYLGESYNNNQYTSGKYYFNCVTYHKDNNTGKYNYYSNSNNQEPLKGIEYAKLTDLFLNNSLQAPIIKNLGVFNMPIYVDGTTHKLTTEGLIYHYEVTPAMPYGLLTEYAQEGYIDFNRIGTKDIKLTSWKYYNYAGTSTLTWGMDAYCEPNKGVKEVVFEFYDNLGLVAAYHNLGKESYSGRFTEYITFGENNTNYKLNSKNRKGDDIVHKGAEVIVDDSTNKDLLIKEGDKYYENDAGILYPNAVYLVKISVKYSDINPIGGFIDNEDWEVEEYRWYWTNGLLNEYYQSVLDYKDIKPTLNFDVSAVYKQSDNFKSNRVLYDPNAAKNITTEPYKQLKANVEWSTGMIDMSVQAGLTNNYNTFGLYSEEIDNIQVIVGLGNEYVSNSEYKTIFSDLELNITDGIYPFNNVDSKPIVSNRLDKLINLPDLYEKGEEEINSSEESYKKYNNYFKLSLPQGSNIKTGLDISYITYSELEGKITEGLDLDLSNIEYNVGKNIQLNYSSMVFSKFMELVNNKKDLLTIVKPLLYDNNDLGKYQMGYKDGHFYLNTWALAFGRTEGDNKHEFNIYQGVQDNSNGYSTSTFTLYARVTGIDESDKLCKPFSTGNILSSIPETAKGIALMHLVRSGTDDDSFGISYQIRYGDDLEENGTIVTSDISGNCFGQRWKSKECVAWNNNSFGRYHNNIATCMPFLTMQDTKGKVHVLNNMFPVITSSSALTQNIAYTANPVSSLANNEITDDMAPDEGGEDTGGGGSSTILPTESAYNKLVMEDTTVGDMVASLLMNLYSASSSALEVEFAKIINLVKLSKYNVLYTRDVVIQVSVKDKVKANNLLLILGIIYNDYIGAVKERAKVTSTNDNNVTFNIDPIIKNCPIQFAYDYIVPNYFENISYNYAIYCSDGSTRYTDVGIPADMLHYRRIEGNNYTDDFMRVDSSFKYALCTKFIDEDGHYIMDYNNANNLYTNFITTDNNFYSAFTLLGGELRCSNSSDLVSDSISYTIHGKGEKDYAGLRTVNKKEALLIDARFSKTN